MTQISPEFQLSLLVYIINKSPKHEVKLFKTRTYPTPLWSVKLNGYFIIYDATFEETRKALLPYIPEDFKQKKTR